MTVEKLLEILSTKGNGQFIKVHWISNLSGKQGATSKKAGDIIEKDVVINLSSIFGGIDVFVPSNCKVKVTSNSMFGGVDNKIKNPHITDKSKTIYINASCVFGGVEVK